MTMLSRRTEFSKSVETVELTEELILEISRFNGNMTPEEVRTALLNNKRVYTFFRSYKLAGMD